MLRSLEFLYIKGLLATAWNPRWITTPFRLFSTVYSMTADRNGLNDKNLDM
jgi:hypothetical protein